MKSLNVKYARSIETLKIFIGEKVVKLEEIVYHAVKNPEEHIG